jgi:hypothetical protein
LSGLISNKRRRNSKETDKISAEVFSESRVSKYMKSRLTALTFSLFVLFFSTLGILLTTKAFADSFTLSGSVTTSTGSEVSGTMVEADSVGTTTSVASATTDGSGSIYPLELTIFM